jgi:hypothetical protein
MEAQKMSKKKVVKMLFLILSALLAVSKHMELEDETETNE